MVVVIVIFYFGKFIHPAYSFQLLKNEHWNEHEMPMRSTGTTNEQREIIELDNDLGPVCVCVLELFILSV